MADKTKTQRIEALEDEVAALRALVGVLQVQVLAPPVFSTAAPPSPSPWIYPGSPTMKPVWTSPPSTVCATPANVWQEF